MSERAFADLLRLYGTPSSGGASKYKSGLRTLLNTDDLDTFIRQRWPDDLHVVDGPVERLAGLCDYDLAALARMKKHHTKAFFRTIDGAPSSVSVSPGQERAMYEAGFTLYFHDLSSSGISEWIGALEGELGLVGGLTRVSAFASRRGAGLPAHYDTNDNFVCQASGVKRWRITSERRVKNPTAGYTIGAPTLAIHDVEAPQGMPTELPTPWQTIEFRPGTVAFVPRGMWHDTLTLDQASLHFNIQSGMPTWKDAIEYVLTGTDVLYADPLREPIFDMFDGDRLRAGVSDDLRKRIHATLRGLLDDELEIDRGSFHRFLRSRRSKVN